MFLDFLFQLWRRFNGYSQWWWLWLFNSKFMLTVAGVVFDRDGKILLQRHRHWVPDVWGLPGGIVHRGERLEDAFTREVLEETGLAVENIRMMRVVSGYRLRLETYFRAHLAQSGKPQAIRLQEDEILEARFFNPSDLPSNLLALQNEIIQAAIYDNHVRS